MIRNNKYWTSNHSWHLTFLWHHVWQILLRRIIPLRQICNKLCYHKSTSNILQSVQLPCHGVHYHFQFVGQLCLNGMRKQIVLYMHVRHRKYHHSKLSQHRSDYPIACVMLCLCYVWVSKLSAITCSKLYLQSLTYSYRQAVLSTFHWPDPFPEMANIFLPNRDPFGFLCLGHLAPWCDRMWVCFMLVGVHGCPRLC